MHDSGVLAQNNPNPPAYPSATVPTRLRQELRDFAEQYRPTAPRKYTVSQVTPRPKPAMIAASGPPIPAVTTTSPTTAQSPSPGRRHTASTPNPSPVGTARAVSSGSNG